MDRAFPPFEGSGVSVIDGNEAVNGVTYISSRGEIGSLYGLTTQNAEPDFNLIEPRSVSRREVKMDVFVFGQPPVPFGLMRVQIVENHVNFPVAVVSYHLIHELEELTPSSPLVVTGLDLTGDHIQGCEQRRGPVSLCIRDLLPTWLPRWAA